MVKWDELPASLRDVVQGHVGPIASATDITDGQNSDVAAVLYGSGTAPAFVKGVENISPRMRWLRNEVAAAPLTGGLSPAVLFSEDIDGDDGRWLLVGFEHVAGQQVSLAPGSPDLPIAAAAVNRIGALPGKGLRPLRERWGITDWWRKLADEAPIAGWDVAESLRWAERFPELVDGDRLAHTDLHGEQFLVDGNDVRVIDWGYPGCGAPWVDPAFMVLRLVESGHGIADAEAWARTHLDHMPDDECLTAFAVYIAGLWGYWAATGNLSGSEHRASLAREYADWRLAVRYGLTPTDHR